MKNKNKDYKITPNLVYFLQEFVKMQRKEQEQIIEGFRLEVFNKNTITCPNCKKEAYYYSEK